MLYDSELRLSKLNSLPPLIIQGKRELVIYKKIRFMFILFRVSEAVVRRCSSKYVFLKISQDSQENICVGVSF